jgi:hypothetical protein
MEAQSSIGRAMDLLTMGYRTDQEVADLLGEDTKRAAKKKLNRDYRSDHIPWYAKRWKPLDDIAQQRHDKIWPPK